MAGQCVADTPTKTEPLLQIVVGSPNQPGLQNCQVPSPIKPLHLIGQMVEDPQGHDRKPTQSLGETTARNFQWSFFPDNVGMEITYFYVKLSFTLDDKYVKWNKQVCA